MFTTYSNPSYNFSLIRPQPAFYVGGIRAAPGRKELGSQVINVMMVSSVHEWRYCSRNIVNVLTVTVRGYTPPKASAELG